LVTEFDAAMELGRWIADDEADSGSDLLVAIGYRAGRASTAALLAGLLDLEPVQAIGTQPGVGLLSDLDDTGWMRLVAAVRDGLRRARDGQIPPGPAGLLKAVAGAKLTVLTGLLLQAAVRRTPVVLDGAAAA